MGFHQRLNPQPSIPVITQDWALTGQRRLFLSTPLPHSKLLPELAINKKLSLPVSLVTPSHSCSPCGAGCAEASVASRSAACPAGGAVALIGYTSCHSSTPPNTSLRAMVRRHSPIRRWRVRSSLPPNWP